MAAHALLDRYGIVTRGVVVNEGVVGGFSRMYRVLSALEDNGATRRGYFIEGLGAAQFAIPEAVDRLRSIARDLSTTSTNREGEGPPAFVLAACDPANPYGAALAWPESATDLDIGHRPGRKVGSLVVIRRGELVIYVERGAKSMLGFTSDESDLLLALKQLVRTEYDNSGIRTGLRNTTIQKFNGQSVLTGTPARLMELAGFVGTPSGMKLR
jgi:ATP-dependent Lhr-like helicase